MKLEIILEKGEGEWWGRLELPGSLLTSVGDTIGEVTTNLSDLLTDYLEHDAPDDPAWKTLRPEAISFTYTYDLTALFAEYEVLNFAAVAEKATIEEALMRQFKAGKGHPTAEQVKRLEAAIHEVGQSLLQVSLG